MSASAGTDIPTERLGVLTKSELGAVADVLRRAGVETSGPLEATPIESGRSNLTLRLSDGGTQWVLRTPPRSGRTPSAHDVAREFRVTTALAGTGVPVPPAVLLCLDESILGSPFTVSGFVVGRSIQTHDDLALYDDAQVGALTHALVSTLARLHSVDHVAAGLESFGRPDGYAERQLRRWSGQWEIVGPDEHAQRGREIVARLADSIPTQRSAAIVHGDYRIDNTIIAVGGREARIAAVVDWELSTIGDPVADVAMMCAYRDPALDLIHGVPSAWTSPRLPSAQELAGGYEEAGGVELHDFGWHLALAYFKIGVIAAGIEHRYRSSAGTDARLGTAGEAVGPYLGLAWEALRRGEG